MCPKHSANLLLMTQQNSSSKKGKPTPARKEREAARKRPLVAPRTKEARQAARAELREKRREASAGYAAGDPKYLPKKDQGPQRAMIRDIVDARWVTVGEILVVDLFIAIFFGYGVGPTNPVTDAIQNSVLVLFVLYIADVILLASRSKRLLSKRFGADKLERGILLYVANRSMFPRIMRIPKARVKRGHKF